MVSHFTRSQKESCRVAVQSEVIYVYRSWPQLNVTDSSVTVTISTLSHYRQGQRHSTNCRVGRARLKLSHETPLTSFSLIPQECVMKRH